MSNTIATYSYLLKRKEKVIWIVLLFFTFLGSVFTEAFGETPGTIKWQYPIVTVNPSAAVTLGQDGSIYVPSGNSLLAVNQNGTLKWSFIGTDSDVLGAPSIGSDGVIYITRFGNGYRPYGNGVYAITTSGNLQWTFDPEGFAVIDTSSGGVAVGEADTMYVHGYSDLAKNQYLYAIDFTGTEKWKSLYGGSVPAIGSNGLIYSNGTYNNLVGLYPLDGSPSVVSPVTIGGLSQRPSIGTNGNIYVIDPYRLYAFSSDGKKVWDYVHQGNFSTQPGEAITTADGSIVFTSYDYYQWVGRIHALNQDGTLKWMLEFPQNWPIGSPAVGDDGTFYVGMSNGVMALYPDGSIQWSNESLRAVSTSYNSPTIGTDGTLYIIGTDTQDGKAYLYAIDTSSTGPDSSSWPMMGANAQHTHVANNITPPPPAGPPAIEISFPGFIGNQQFTTGNLNYYKFTLTEPASIGIVSTGSMDLKGTLYQLDTNSDLVFAPELDYGDHISHGFTDVTGVKHNNFMIRAGNLTTYNLPWTEPCGGRNPITATQYRQLPAGTYYLSVEPDDGASSEGTYGVLLLKKPTSSDEFIDGLSLLVNDDDISNDYLDIYFRALYPEIYDQRGNRSGNNWAGDTINFHGISWAMQGIS